MNSDHLSNETQILMKLRYYKLSAVISVSCNKTQTFKAKRIKVCKSNYPIAFGYWKLSHERSYVGLLFVGTVFSSSLVIARAFAYLSRTESLSLANISGRKCLVTRNVAIPAVFPKNLGIICLSSI